MPYPFTPGKGTLNKLLLTHKKKTPAQQGLFKPQSSEQPLLGEDMGIKAGSRYLRAPVAAYLAGKAGIATPHVEIVELIQNGKAEVGSFQAWSTEGTDVSELYMQHGQPLLDTLNQSQPKLDLDAFDFVIANMDRNPGNWRVVRDARGNVQNVIAIDMDTSLPTSRERYSPGKRYPTHQPELPRTISPELYKNLKEMSNNRATIAREMAHLPEAAKVIDGVFYRLDQVLRAVEDKYIQVVP